MPAGMGDERAGRATANDLIENLKAVMRDAEALLREAGDRAREKSAAGDASAEPADSARKPLHEAGADIGASARSAARSADAYVRDNPWAAVAVAAGIGYLLGLLGRRR